MSSPAKLLLTWHIEHASYLIETPQNLITSPFFTTPTGDTWLLILKPEGLRRGDPCEYRIVYLAGRDPIRIVKCGEFFLQTPKVMWTSFLMGSLPIVEGGEITCDRSVLTSRLDGVGGDDRVTIEVRLWMVVDGVSGPPVKLQAISTLQLTPLVFVASCDGTGINERLILDEPESGLEEDVKLDMWSPDGAKCGFIVHLGYLFQGVQSIKATFVFRHPSPLDENGNLQTNIERSVMFHRWNGGTCFRVPPFFPKGPGWILCKFKSFSGEINDRVEELGDDQLIGDQILERGVVGAQQEVEVIIDVEQQEEPRRSRSVLGSLRARMDMGKLKNIIHYVLMLVNVFVILFYLYRFVYFI